jgi:hypothetical protein
MSKNSKELVKPKIITSFILSRGLFDLAAFYKYYGASDNDHDNLERYESQLNIVTGRDILSDFPEKIFFLSLIIIKERTLSCDFIIYLFTNNSPPSFINYQ